MDDGSYFPGPGVNGLSFIPLGPFGILYLVFVLPNSFSLKLYFAGPGEIILSYFKPFSSVPNFVTGTFNEPLILYFPTPGISSSSLSSSFLLFLIFFKFWDLSPFIFFSSSNFILFGQLSPKLFFSSSNLLITVIL